MELARLIEELSRPAAYPDPVDFVAVRQTHISVVFLTESFVYKIKKPVSPGFLDFNTLEKRQHFCREEVRLNRRLAPDVYLDVVPVVDGPKGLRFESTGEPVEWAVKMRRLPEPATLLERLKRNELTAVPVANLAERIAAFHRGAERNEGITSRAHFSETARSIDEVLDRARRDVQHILGTEFFERLRRRFREALDDLKPLIEARAARGVPCDAHGDLHLDHVYYFPERTPPDDLVIIDCIEFNERFRFIDPVMDMAFAAMDFDFHGRPDLARVFADVYFQEADDEEGRRLFSIFKAYRAAVRGMVEGLLLGEAEVAEPERSRARVRSRAHWLLALGEIELPARRPALVLVGGLPGSGKSTMARMLAERAGFQLVRSDVIRKRLAGLLEDVPTPEHLRGRLYSSEWNKRTYAECERRAELILSAGGRALVDANLRREEQRRAFRDLAVSLGIPVVVLICVADEGTTRSRLQSRKNDPSDADWAVYDRAANEWQALSEDIQRIAYTLSTTGSVASTFEMAARILVKEGLADESQVLANDIECEV